MTTRDDAGDAAETLAARMADPTHVLSLMSAQAHASKLSLWRDASMHAGAASMAILFGELADARADYRAVADQYLRIAARACRPGHVGHGLLQGPAGLAYTIRLIRLRQPDRYGKALAQLDEVVDVEARQLLRAVATRPPATFHEFDLVSGLTGIGRYLLMDVGRFEDLLREILGYLAALVTPRRVRGTVVPGWWVDGTPFLGAAGARYRSGHLNLGVAHGISGPLALMALAFRAGVRVPRLQGVMTQLAEWMLDQRFVIDGVVRWPSVVGLAEIRHGFDQAAGSSVSALGWCYGTPGIARALQLAGYALDRPDVTRAAVEAAESIVAHSPEATHDMALCHGASGLLQCMHRIAADDLIAGADTYLQGLAAAIIAAGRPHLPFLYPFHLDGDTSGDVSDTVDDPGLLNGSAGVALALWTFRNGIRPTTQWDAAFLLV